MITRWKQMLRSAVVAGVSPDEFWRLPVRDWIALTSHSSGSAPLSRQELSRLRQSFPDSVSDPILFGTLNTNLNPIPNAIEQVQ